MRFHLSRTRQTHLLLTSCLLALAAGQQAAAQALDTATTSAGQSRGAPLGLPAHDILLLEPSMNGGDPDPPIFVVRRGDGLLLPETYLRRHGIVSTEVRREISGQNYVDAAGIPSLIARVDEANGKLSMECSAACFGSSSVVASYARSATVSAIEPGAFFNYDAYAEAGDAGASSGAFVEFGVFSDFGTGVTGLFCSHSEDESNCGRLDTSWTIDDPATARRLVLGDSLTQAARWGAPARFAGISWGTDFSLQPEFVTFPTPVMRGESTLASSVDVYINDALRFQTQIPAGPFRITDIPVITGEGTARTVVRDLLGREQSVVTSFYSAPELLRSGLDKYGVEAGLLRKNFGGDQERYEDPFVAAGYSRGLSDRVTVSVRSELGSEQQSIGASAMMAKRRVRAERGRARVFRWGRRPRSAWADRPGISVFSIHRRWCRNCCDARLPHFRVEPAGRATRLEHVRRVERRALWLSFAKLGVSRRASRARLLRDRSELFVEHHGRVHIRDCVADKRPSGRLFRITDYLHSPWRGRIGELRRRL
jgi:outer membrane usher protein FimD/PapC